MDHSELIQEMVLLEKMTAQERLKHARRRRQQQLKSWTQREAVSSQTNGTTPSKSPSKKKKISVKFPENIVILEGNLQKQNFLDQLTFNYDFFQQQHDKISMKYVNYFNRAYTIQIPRMKTVSHRFINVP